MSTLLHLDASARRHSISRELSAAFAEAWRVRHPDSDYRYRDLAAEPVPFIGEAWTQLCDAVLALPSTDARRIGELVRTPQQAAAWEIVEPLLAELLSADVILIGTPMYNYSIPASLKAWLDQVTFPRMSLEHRRFIVTSARGGAYSPGAPKAAYDYQERFLRDFFAGHFAVSDTVFVHAELANSRQDPVLANRRAEHDESYARALATVRDLAGEY
ncbi:NAD(P)H-dependent oxidoreductase [Streptomyces gardneri]|jgi:FMN-dependent NADH-azoreductase|uniref:FMN-dependent NADH-azoreductase n=1 Tax=Nocardia TaxID=1817 RepID=UPI0013585FA8|nr:MULTISPECIES: NAD(P)H-dependent oxidoreductase [Nocardia]MBF6165195.1 NAD(P)H-dependent oxidoreductase [Streptomyces gardneri]MBF6208115.1 NAD(P)H-dependent oxidoreductase [Streptomyces gardneri]UAK34351.1 NAD(P)H-dependent oxidoreductase [Nocardia asteroides]